MLPGRMERVGLMVIPYFAMLAGCQALYFLCYTFERKLYKMRGGALM